MLIANSDRRMVFAGAEKMPQGSTVTKSHMTTHRKEKSKVIVTESSDLPVDIESFKNTLGGLAEVKSIEVPMRQLSSSEEDELIRELVDVEALFVRSGIIGKRVIDSSRKLKVIAIHGVGVEQVDVSAATENDIMVTNVPGGNAEAVAELAIGIILALWRKIPLADKKVREEKWSEGKSSGIELKGKTLGIIGLGHIGSRVAELGRAFDMNLLGYDPYVAPARVRSMGVQIVDLETLLKESDIVSIHVPLTEQTRQMIGEKELRLMKQTSILVNTARGAIVDEKELCSALENGVIAGAALDTFEEEPLDSSNPLLKMDKVVITPHIGGSTRECLTFIAVVGAKDIAKVLRGEFPENLVNRDILTKRGTRAAAIAP